MTAPPGMLGTAAHMGNATPTPHKPGNALTSIFLRNLLRDSPEVSFFFRKAAALMPSPSSSSSEEEEPGGGKGRDQHWSTANPATRPRGASLTFRVIALPPLVLVRRLLGVLGGQAG